MKRSMLTRLALALLLGWTSAAVGQSDVRNWPAKPIRVVVGLAAGGGTDTIMRLMAPKLAEGLGQPVIVENRTGAGGIIAAEHVVKSPADGYTLTLAPSGLMVANIVMRRQLSYSQRDFTPVALVCTFPLVLVVNSSLPVKSVAELNAYVKANPAKAIASGSGPAFQLPTALLAQRVGVPVEFVMYKGSNESVSAVMAGDVLFAFVDVGPALGAIKGNRLRPLAVTSTARLRDFPDVPTMAEAGLPDLEVRYWMGLFAPARTPAPVVRRLEEEVNRVLKQPDIQEAFRAKLVEPVGGTSEELGRFVDAEIERWGAVRRGANIPQIE